MRWLALVVVLGGCGGDVCDRFDGQSCIALAVRGPFAVDQLGVAVAGLFGERSTPSPPLAAPRALPVELALLPGERFTPPLVVSVRGLRGGQTLAQGGQVVALAPGQHARATVDLSGPDAFVPPEGSLPDGFVVPEAGPPPDGAGAPDLAPATGGFFAANAGIEGANVTALLADFAGGTAFVGTAGTGVFKTSDRGATWQPDNDGLTNLYVHALAASLTTGRYYAAASTGTLNFDTHALFHSTDGARTWTKIFDAPDPINAVAFVGSTTVMIALDGNGGIQRASDGVMFQPINTGLTNLQVTSLVPDILNTGTVYAGTSDGSVFKTSDDGDHWTSVSTGLPLANGSTVIEMTGLAIDPRTVDTVVGCSFGGGLEVTSNGGASWSAFSPQLPSTAPRGLVFAQSSTLDLFVGTSDKGMFRLQQGDTAWKAVNGGLPVASISAVAMDLSDSTLVWAGTPLGVAVSTTSGDAWTPSSQGLHNVTVESLAIDPKTPSTIYAGGPTVFTSGDGANNWSASSSGVPALAGIAAIAIDPQHPATLWVSDSAHGQLLRSTNSGASFSPVDVGASASITSIVVDPRDSSTVYVALGRVRKTTTGGALWSDVSTGLSPTTVVLAIDPGNSQALYAGASDGVYVTTTGGAQWTQMSSGFSSMLRAVGSLVVDPIDPTRVYAGALGSLQKSTNRAQSWSDVTPDPAGSSWLVRVAPSNDQIVWAASDHGLYRSDDAAASWTHVTAGVTTRDFPTAIAIDPTNPDVVYVAYDQGPAVLKTLTGGR